MRCDRQNRRLRALILPLCVLVCLPFIFGWNSGSDGNFDRVTASSIIVKSGDKILLSMGTSFNSGGAELKLFGADHKLAARLEAERDSCGSLSFFGPNSHPNVAQAQIVASRTGNAMLRMHNVNRQNAVYLSSDGRGAGFMTFANQGSKGSLMYFGSDSKSDATIRMSDSEGKTTVVLDSIPRTIVAGTANRRALPGRDVSATGGGGRLTLSDPSGAATFRAPVGAAGN